MRINTRLGVICPTVQRSIQLADDLCKQYPGDIQKVLTKHYPIELLDNENFIFIFLSITDEPTIKSLASITLFDEEEFRQVYQVY